MSKHDVLELPMSHLTRADWIFRVPMILAPLIIFFFMAFGTTVPYFNYLGYTALIIAAILFVFHWATRISHTQFNFGNKTIRRYFAHNPFRRHVDFGFDRFAVVLSEGAPRLGTVTVKLTGRHGSIVVATYGPSDTYITGNGMFDHPKAHELRCDLERRLNLRNLGSV